MLLTEIIDIEVNKILEECPKLNMLNKKQYIKNLICCAELMFYIDNLLKSAIVWSSELGDKKLISYYKKHYKEENWHYPLIKNDIEASGIEVNYPEEISKDAKNMISFQKGNMRDNLAVGFLGYLYVMESNPMPIDVVDQISKEHGYDLTRTLRLHSEDDIKHSEELKKLINKFDGKDGESILLNAINTASYRLHITKKIAEIED